jgi:hypothetical protein
MNSENYVGKLKSSLVWWLGARRSFFINGEYKIELLHIDREHNSAKIRITNLKTNEIIDSVSQEASDVEDFT